MNIFSSKIVKMMGKMKISRKGLAHKSLQYFHIKFTNISPKNTIFMQIFHHFKQNRPIIHHFRAIISQNTPF